MSWLFRQNSNTSSALPAMISVCLLSFFLLYSSRGHSIELAGGIASVEEGDDRLRPGLALHLGYTPFYYTRAFFYGRDFGPVKERTSLVSFNRRFGLFRSKYIKGGIGGAILSEHNTITYENEEDQDFNMDENKYNFGLYTGIYWDFGTKGPLYFSFGWESALFPAGLNGLLFLSTGRKQFISVTMGVSI